MPLRVEHDALIIAAIDESPLNRGLSGAAWLDHPGNVAIVLEHDIALFDDVGDGNYEVHFLFQSRGRPAIVAARESFERLFENYGAELIYGLVPDFRRDVKMLARWAGGKSVGLRETANGLCELFVLSREMWSDQ
jgi:hypothetical protein